MWLLPAIPPDTMKVHTSEVTSSWGERIGLLGGTVLMVGSPLKVCDREEGKRCTVDSDMTEGTLGIMRTTGMTSGELVFSGAPACSCASQA